MSSSSIWLLFLLACLSIFLLYWTALMSTPCLFLSFILLVGYLANLPQIQIWLEYFAAQKTLMTYLCLNNKSPIFLVWPSENCQWPGPVQHLSKRFSVSPTFFVLLINWLVDWLLCFYQTESLLTCNRQIVSSSRTGFLPLFFTAVSQAPATVAGFWLWVLVAQSCLTLDDPMDWSPPGSSVHGVLQARILEWVAIGTG